jgi:hypothetical protein
MGLSAFLLSLLLVYPSLGSPVTHVFTKASNYPWPGRNKITIDPKIVNDMTIEIQRNAWELDKQSFCRNSTSRGQVFFSDQYDRYREFMITTPWHIGYPSKLRARLMANGFWVSERPRDTCHWLRMGEFKSKGMYRGKIAYRHLTEITYTIGDARDAGYPHPEVLARVQVIMNETFPGTELGLILFFSLVPFVVLAVCLASRLRKGWLLRRYNCGGGERIEDDCVELVDTPKKKKDNSDVVDEVDKNTKVGLSVSTSTEIA